MRAISTAHRQCAFEGLGGAASGWVGIAPPSGAKPGTPSPVVTESACATACGIGAARSIAVTAAPSGEFDDSTGPPIRLFGYSPSRSTAAAQLLYACIRGGAALMSDGYAVYDQIAKAHRLVHLACWAHCRRDFNDALQALPKNARGPDQLAAQFIALIGQLYGVEARGRELKLGAKDLLALRQQHSMAVLRQIEALLLVHLHAVLPGSLLGKALHYLSAQWPKLSWYVTDGNYPIDNNACENSIRPFVVGRKNWLFSDTVAGANASANLYCLLQTCAANGVEGYRYLRALLVALHRAQTADGYEALLPWNIALPAQ